MRRLQQVVFITLALLVPAAATAAQTAAPGPVAPPAPAPRADTQTAARVDEDFELNISMRRITERDFYAATAISTDAAQVQGLRLRIGVALSARTLDVLLREVHGQVRFHGSLERVLRVLDARRPDAPPAAATPVP